MKFCITSLTSLLTKRFLQELLILYYIYIIYLKMFVRAYSLIINSVTRSVIILKTKRCYYSRTCL